MSLTIQKQQLGLSPKDRRRLSELGYTVEDINKQGIQKSREIIKNSTVKPGATDRGKTPLSKQQRLNQGAIRLNNSLLPKLEATARRTGIPINQLKTGKWEKHKYYLPTSSEMGYINTYVGKMNSLKKQGWVPPDTTVKETQVDTTNVDNTINKLRQILNKEVTPPAELSFNNNDLSAENKVASNLTIPSIL
jgi:hypothetical protein